MTLSSSWNYTTYSSKVLYPARPLPEKESELLAIVDREPRFAPNSTVEGILTLADDGVQSDA